MPSLLLDSHFHLDFLAPKLREPFVDSLIAQGAQVVAQTLLPSAYKELAAYSPSSSLRGQAPLLSLGFHPWWITSPEQAERELAIFEEEVMSTRFIGEIGLDFLPRRLETASADLQLQVLGRILLSVKQAATGWPADQPYVLSLHAVRAVSPVLDLLDQLTSPDCSVVPVMHRFGGSSDELTRLIKLGGYISVHPQMLETKRGRAYVRQVPAERLLLETDLPESPTAELDSGLFARQVAGYLQQMVDDISALRDEDFLLTLLATQALLYPL
ncbi:TatD family hydrolase [Rothia sp. P4278]|uniref:TatD family hydrolase n=1 Tax=Rothia sp. P4278 TaxID=3402658 RepID=UPI003ADFCB10